jgi:hypothetical protein
MRTGNVIIRRNTKLGWNVREAMMINTDNNFMMDDESPRHISELEKNSRFPTGVGQIERGECEFRARNPMACTFCTFGHMLCCHYPMTCDEAQCSHYEEASVDDG